MNFMELFSIVNELSRKSIVNSIMQKMILPDLTSMPRWLLKIEGSGSLGTRYIDLEDMSCLVTKEKLS